MLLNNYTVYNINNNRNNEKNDTMTSNDTVK